MIKRLRDRLNNKKGFTLVELIVVIVIILILAAVLIPNVMRYINEARKSTFQSEASAYLTELQGYAAERYGKEDIDLATVDIDPASGATYELTEFDADAGVFEVKANEADVEQSGVTTEDKTIYVYVNKGAVTAFSYSNNKYFVNWTQGDGWDDVSE